jgi:hypothetical protein
LKSVLIFGIIILVLYFGWPIIEAIIILLPIPDPKEVMAKLRGVLGRFKKQQSDKKGGPNYTPNFNQAPETLGESDEEEAADDVGQAPKVKKRKPKNEKRQGLSYGDSDEDEEKEGT